MIVHNTNKNKYLNFEGINHYLQLLLHDKSLYKLLLLLITSLISTCTLLIVDAKFKPLLSGTNKYLIEVLEGGLFSLIILLPFMYVFRKELPFLFKKVNWKQYKNSLTWASVVLILTSLSLLIFTYFIPINLHSNNVFTGGMSILLIRIIRMILQIFGENLMLISMFFLFYKLIRIFTSKASILIITSITIASICFGLAHLPTYNYNLAHCIFLIGIPATAHLIMFIKHQNILMGYFIHLNYDLIILALKILTIIQSNPAL